MSSISTIGQTITQTARLKSMQTSLATLQQQLTTGKKAQLFSGLGTDVITSQRARSSTTELETYMNNMINAERRIKMQSNAMESIMRQAKDVVGALEVQTVEGEIELQSIGDLAKKARAFINSMMNEKDGDRYIFSGADAHTPPLGDTSLQQTYLKTQIKNWTDGNLSTDDLIKSYADKSTGLNDTLNGYNPRLAANQAGYVTVRVDANIQLDYTVHANESSFRDILTAVGVLESLASSLDEVSLDPVDNPAHITAPGASKEEQAENFYKVFNHLGTMINKAMDSMESATYRLSMTSARMSQLQDAYLIEKNTLSNVIASIEDISEPEVIMRIQQLSTQLEASFSVTSVISRLTLANYI
jgi:flagellar hook-associated protein 3 FlgL